MTGAAIMLVALVVDILIGWPKRLLDRIGHPVIWIGTLIDMLDRRLNQDPSDAVGRVRNMGGLALAIVVLVVGCIAIVIATALPDGTIGIMLAGIVAWPLVATRSMHDHVTAVSEPLLSGDLAGARQAVGQIVGRDPSKLDEAGVARSALESLAENTSDGIVAPIFWGVLFGLPGIAVYKAINTLDSMIGHRTERHEHFGWASAKLDDLVNLIPARLTGLLFVASAKNPGAAFSCMRADARNHRSPNAGWPEAAMAGALSVRLSGPRQYGDVTADEPWLNGAARDPQPTDLEAGLVLFRRSVALLAVLLTLIALI